MIKTDPTNAKSAKKYDLPLLTAVFDHGVSVTTPAQKTSLLPLLLQVLGRLTACHCTTSHDHDDILGLWVAIIGIEGVAHTSLLLHQPGEISGRF